MPQAGLVAPAGRRPPGSPVAPPPHLPRVHPASSAQPRQGLRLAPLSSSPSAARGRKGGSPASFIAHRRPLERRCVTPGWEADLMLALPTARPSSSRAPLPPPPRRPSRRQSRSTPSPMVLHPRPLTSSWRRTVFPQAAPSSRGSMTLGIATFGRPPRPLAERRHRKCHRPPAPLPAPQDRPGHPAQRGFTQLRRRPTPQHPARASASATRPPNEVFRNYPLHSKCDSTGSARE